AKRAWREVARSVLKWQGLARCGGDSLRGTPGGLATGGVSATCATQIHKSHVERRIGKIIRCAPRLQVSVLAKSYRTTPLQGWHCPPERFTRERLLVAHVPGKVPGPEHHVVKWLKRFLRPPTPCPCSTVPAWLILPSTVAC